MQKAVAAVATKNVLVAVADMVAATAVAEDTAGVATVADTAPDKKFHTKFITLLFAGFFNYRNSLILLNEKRY